MELIVTDTPAHLPSPPPTHTQQEIGIPDDGSESSEDGESRNGVLVSEVDDLSSDSTDSSDDEDEDDRIKRRCVHQ